MNRPLAITQRQIKAICEGAKKAGRTPIFEIGNIVIKLVPDELVVIPQPKNAVEPEEEIDL